MSVRRCNCWLRVTTAAEEGLAFAWAVICARPPGEGKPLFGRVAAAIDNCIGEPSLLHLQRICSKRSPIG